MSYIRVAEDVADAAALSGRMRLWGESLDGAFSAISPDLKANVIIMAAEHFPPKNLPEL